VTWPAPQAGLVIRYNYLWEREARSGREEGVKDRPCAVLLVIKDEGDLRPVVWVLPVTHTPPHDPDTAVEIPLVTKQRLGLDGERSWVVLTETNEFRWPGPDLRPVVRGEAASIIYGMLPPRLYAHLRSHWIERFRKGRATRVRRTE
jgi:hypothetical protein